MKMKNLIEAKILIVDDKDYVLEQTEDRLNSIRNKDDEGINNFDIKKVDTLERALRILHENIDTPFNIVLLDLALEKENLVPPELEDIKILEDDKLFTGFTILRFIQKTSSAEYVIVVSGHPEDDNIRKSFRLGASDFLIQPCGSSDLQKRFLSCWKSLLLNKSQHILEQRISDLVPYAEKGLAYQFTTCFSNFAQESVHYADDIERYMQERFGLENQKDAEDFFFTRLKEHKNNLDRTKKNWEDLQASVVSIDKSFKEDKIENIIDEIHKKLLPCLIVKNVELEYLGENSASILSLDSDVSVVFQEIIFGVINDLHDHNEKKEIIKIEIEDTEGQVKVRFIDNLECLKEEDVESINKGLNISPHRRFGREWGLSVVQQIAIRGGGRLEIEPHSEGNIINYYIPTAR